ncbi:MAG TPA: hypothetical protein VG710_16505 [Opitutus sp.]|nr:hypothetical protein [Opitutus sp.]
MPEPYTGLQVRSEDLFPLHCDRCRKQYYDLPDFIARTTPVFQSSGLMERMDPASGTFVLLLRNCTCDTSLALRCHDRRDRSSGGALRRRRYEILVEMLIESGDTPDEAREQARRVLREGP